MTTNGTVVTRAELAAHIKGIDEHFDSVEDSVEELRVAVGAVGLDVKALLGAWDRFKGSQDQRDKFLATRRYWANGLIAVFAATFGAAIGTGAWFLLS